jgi:hypothetical protein
MSVPTIVARLVATLASMIDTVRNQVVGLTGILYSVRTVNAGTLWT